MNRFFVALQVAGDPPPLPALTKGLAQAVEEAIADGENPDACPAVMLLGAFVAFRTHADMNTVGGYRRLIDLCQDRIDERDLQ